MAPFALRMRILVQDFLIRVHLCKILPGLVKVWLEDDGYPHVCSVTFVNLLKPKDIYIVKPA